MLYTLIGNGEANTKEVLLSLQALREAANQNPETDFWMLFREPGPEVELSNTVDAIFKWVIAEQIYYEVVVAEGGEVTTFMSADEIHQAKRPLGRMLTLTKGRVQPGELSALLILSDDIENDQDALFAINEAIAQDIPVFDLGGQMVALELEPEEAPSEPQPLDNKDFTLPLPDDEVAAAEEPEFLRADLEKLTRDELKSLATIRKLTPKDWRSKDSLIDVLLGEVPVEEAAPEPQPLADTSQHEAAVLANETPTGIEVRLVTHYVGNHNLPTEGVLEKLLTDGFGLLACVGVPVDGDSGQVIYTFIKNHDA